ncbi:methylated-DNA--[protein]-cysteine S-methyltransferase [Nocardia sp. NRRL S-836]|uniref:methylated-DNA--[protein]-cysteine S-methyltransferase n=1 Tax=Nocardia sp. NRRL S-836 TaxID=1519492 RepID=UPI000B07344D|nr:methylated-DNA--[protein]-cysteine S-methyltransferase [Nocardia sp. NRRL S-836]
MEFAAPLGGPRRFTTTTPTPIGELLLLGDGESITGLYMLPDHLYMPSIADDWVRDPGLFGELERQLDAYFAGELKVFDVPLAPRGTPFQLDVWRELSTVPCGVTTTYGAMALAIGKPTASRAVGAANGRNPISIILPCHRVVGANGSLTGYGGGLPRKMRLLDMERG